jgi:cytochrome b6
VPVVGESIVRVMRGGDDVTGATLSRFYALHIAILPAIATLLLGLHIYLVQKHGMSVPIGVQKQLGGKSPKGMPFLPNFILRDMVGWLGALALLAGLAALLPEGDGFFVKLDLGEKANPFGAAPVGLKPEWYFLAMFHSLKILPAHIIGMEGEQFGVLLFSIAGLFFLLVPFLDRKASRGETNRLFPILGVIAILWLVTFTILGRVVD